MYGSVMMKAFGNGRSATQADNDHAYTGLLSATFYCFDVLIIFICTDNLHALLQLARSSISDDS